MAKVTKTGAGTSVKSTLVLRAVKVILQHYPGTANSDASRCISNIPYKLYFDGTLHKTTTTSSAADGSITVPMPPGVLVELEVFGTRYKIKIVNALEPLNTTKGAQRRLYLLGYEMNGIDGIVGARTDTATLKFQADAGDDTSGTIDNNMQNKLKNIIGE